MADQRRDPRPARGSGSSSSSSGRPQQRSSSSSGSSRGSAPRSGDKRAGDKRDGDKTRGQRGARTGSRAPRKGDWSRPTEEQRPRSVDQATYDGPPIPEEITGAELDRTVSGQLKGLPEKLASRVARHLAAAGLVIETVRHLKGRLTILAVAHQGALIDAADRLYRLADARIAPVQRQDQPASVSADR